MCICEIILSITGGIQKLTNSHSPNSKCSNTSKAKWITELKRFLLELQNETEYNFDIEERKGKEGRERISSIIEKAIKVSIIFTFPNFRGVS